MKKRFYLKGILFVLFVGSFYAGSSFIKSDIVAAWTRYDVSPTYNTTEKVFQVPYQLRGGTYYSLKVQKYGGSDATIDAKYWVGHNSSKRDSVGTQMMYNPKIMTLNGFYESDGYGQNMNLTLDSTQDGLRWLKAEGAIDPNNFGLIGYGFKISPSYTYFNNTAMDGVTRHSMAGPSAGYYLGWTSPITRIYGSNMIVYKN